ncbi:MAG TPA: hydroxyacid dehydrogenase [Polyangia bacterium]|nr:hydroxyacid dehydrogenase [Polyangia bacterium]
MADPIRILIADDMSRRAVEILQKAGFSVDVKVGLPPAELAAIIGEYHGLGIRSATKVTAAILDQPGKLKIIGRAGVGVDNIDVKAAIAKGVLVINTPQGNAAAAAELAIGLMFALARKIPQAAESMRQGIWEKKKFMGAEISGKTLGVIGLGNIGRHAAERGVGLKMSVIGYDPYVKSETGLPAGVKLASLDDVISKSDFITLHVPLSAETKNLFDAATIAKMKKGAYLINCARGGIVNEEAVLEALKSGQLAGAALDVFGKEPPDPSPLFAHENLIATPHLGASTREAQEKVAIELAEVFVGYLKDGIVRNAVS